MIEECTRNNCGLGTRYAASGGTPYLAPIKTPGSSKLIHCPTHSKVPRHYLTACLVSVFLLEGLHVLGITFLHLLLRQLPAPSVGIGNSLL